MLKERERKYLFSKQLKLFFLVLRNRPLDHGICARILSLLSLPPRRFLIITVN